MLIHTAPIRIGTILSYWRCRCLLVLVLLLLWKILLLPLPSLLLFLLPRGSLEHLASAESRWRRPVRPALVLLQCLSGHSASSASNFDLLAICLHSKRSICRHRRRHSLRRCRQHSRRRCRSGSLRLSSLADRPPLTGRLSPRFRSSVRIRGLPPRRLSPTPYHRVDVACLPLLYRSLLLVCHNLLPASPTWPI